MNFYHYCILHGQGIYSDGAYSAEEPITPDNFKDITAKIARERGVDISKPFVFIALNRL